MQKTGMLKQVMLFLFSVLTLASCVAPRVISNSGKVTPKGNFAGGYHTSYNISTQTSLYVKDLLVNNIEDLALKDSIKFDENFININKAAIAYQLDPISSGNEFYLKYGVFKRWDIGAKLAGNAKQIYGSIGLQFTTQSQSLPSVLSYLQDRLGYNFNRKDFLMPVLFSYSFGNEEEYGSLSWGLAANYSIVNYSSTPIDIYNLDKTSILPQNYQQKYMSYGFFINAKVGFQHVFVIPSLSMFYQNYGSYQLLNGSSSTFKGMTIVPGIGFRVRVGRNTYAKKTSN